MDMVTLWEVIAFIILLLSLFNTIALNYYYFVTKQRRARSIPAMLFKMSVPVLAYLAATGLVYFSGSKFRKTIQFEISGLEAFQLSNSFEAFPSRVVTQAFRYEATVSMLYTFLAPFVLLSQLSFAVFGGAGMALLPINCIYAYLNRPKQPEPESHVLAKKVLRDSTDTLIVKGRQIYDLQRDIQLNTSESAEELRNKKNAIKSRLYELKCELIEFEEIFEQFDTEDNFLECNPLVYIGYLILGIIFTFLSILIIVHASMTAVGIYGILEWAFLKVAKYNTVVSMFMFVLLAGYLWVASFYGSISLSYLMHWALNTHPVKANGTWTDSFLLNINFGLFSTMGMIFFLLNYCRNFLRFLDVNTLFLTIVSRIQILHPLKKGLVYGYVMMLFFLTAFFVSFFLITSRANMQEKVEKQKRDYKADKDKLRAFEVKEDQSILS
jgi:hypothetical protein